MCLPDWPTFCQQSQTVPPQKMCPIEIDTDSLKRRTWVDWKRVVINSCELTISLVVCFRIPATSCNKTLSNPSETRPK